MIGRSIGAYEVLSKLGEGGMGEVYRARDTRLKREVALKVLPADVSTDAERLARFQREAEVLASLNHPNIAQIHGIEDSGDTTALVMELVDGDDLSAVIAGARGRETPGTSRGPEGPALHLADALAIARQIIDALEAAHERGIVHRDLKPANIKVRPDGTVKVLDFGLAKALGPQGDGSRLREQDPSPSNSPTLTARATQAGMILGTAAYMSPEQARGKAVDKRADVWAFGAVLFEMLSGARAFPGDNVTDTLAAVVRAEPDWSRLPPDVPPTLGVFLKRCLEKDPKQRVPDMATMRLVLEGAFDTPAARAAPPVAARSSRPATVRALAVVAAVSLAVAAAALVTRPAVLQQPQVRLTIPLPPGAEITSYPAITPDGRTVAYVARQGSEDAELYLRDLDAFDARLVAGSSGARQPFFSPDGRWIAFFAKGQLLKAEVAGGAPVKVADATYPFGGTWMEDNRIIYVASLSSGLLQVPAGGGTPTPVSRPDAASSGYAHVFPQRLPGGPRVLFTIWGRQRGAAVLSLESGTWELVLPGTTFESATYDPSSGAPGRLLVVDQAAGIRAAPFDPSHPAPTSADDSVLENVYYELETEALGWLAVSETGTAAYASGNPARTSLVWVGRDGSIVPLGSGQDVYREASISPDGTKAVVRQALNLWVHDLARGTQSPLTSGSDSNILPVWSRDQERVVFASNRGGDWDIYSQPADGSRPAELLLELASDQFPYGFAQDGTLLYTEIGPETGRDLWTLSPDGKASPLRVTRFNEWAAQFSPEPGGPRWIAYASDESGRPEIYVQAYPGEGRRIPVSTGGGMRPMWSPDGRELYFVTGDALVAVTMQADGTFGTARKVIDRSALLVNDRFQSYSVSPDGQRFLMIRRDEGSAPRELNVILNWSGKDGRR